MGHWHYVTPEEYAAAAAIGISPATLDQRIRQYGWDKQRAITTPPRKRTDHSRWWPVMEKHGIPQEVYLNRISRGWDPERAATEPLLTPDKRSDRMRNDNPRGWSYPQDLIDRAARNGVSRNTFAKRVSKGW